MLRRFRRVTFFVAVAGSAACNMITGAHERFLDESIDGAAPVRPDANRDGAADGELDGTAPAKDADAADAGPLVVPVDVGGTWASPNGATYADVGGGKKIATYDGGANHPVIIPSPQPTVPSADYSVRAVVVAPNTAAVAEFGVLVRVQADGSGVAVSSSYGQQPEAFVGHISASSNWNPSLGQKAPAYTWVPGAKYTFYVNVKGNEVRGKFWLASDPEPQSWQLLFLGPASEGRGVGFYTYGIVDAVLETMVITVP